MAQRIPGNVTFLNVLGLDVRKRFSLIMLERNKGMQRVEKLVSHPFQMNSFPSVQVALTDYSLSAQDVEQEGVIAGTTRVVPGVRR